jgi:hypothetical protein
LRGIEEPRPRQTFKILSLIHKAEYDAHSQHLVSSEVKLLKELLERPAGQAHTFVESGPKWSEVAVGDSLLYFYCHADPDRISLGELDEIDVLRFHRDFRRGGSIADTGQRARRTYCLVFINGCMTAAGQGTSGFLYATFRQGFCGFIGTETKVPCVFALRYGAGFLHRLLDRGESVQEVMRSLRSQHWPLSLVYSAYCHPDFRVERNPSYRENIELSSIKGSFEQVGLRTMGAS